MICYVYTGKAGVDMERLTRKIDEYLLRWKESSEKKPLIVKGNVIKLAEGNL